MVHVSPDTLLARAGLAAGDRTGPRPGGTQAGPEAAPAGSATSGRPRPLSQPIDQSSVYVFDTLKQVDEIWEGRRPGHVYRRLGHPNQAALEEVVAALEETEAAVAFSSGMGALYASLAAHVRAGEAVVVQEGLYGGTKTLLGDWLSRSGVLTVFAGAPTAGAFRAALSDLEETGARPRALLVETISNPLLTVADIPALASLAARMGLVLIVDNTFATPLACRPSRWGEVVVVHSVTKYLNGHSDVLGGAAAGPAHLLDPVREAASAIGLTMAPLEAWLTLRGLRTLHLRLSRQQRTALVVALWLEGRRGVSRVFYPGLKSHPSHDVARRVLDGFGAMVSFELEGGEEAVRAFIERLELISFAPSLGETATTVTYPARTSHRSLPEDERTAAGATPGLIRLSVGLEDPADILGDLERALEA